MKKLFMSVALLLLVVTSFAQTPGYEFTTVVSHQATPVKDCLLYTSDAADE